jgi:hypothetical protein
VAGVLGSYRHIAAWGSVGALLARLGDGGARLATWLSLSVGTALVSLSYSRAATSLAQHPTFDLFWVGALFFFVPVVIRLSDAKLSRTERLCLVVALGLFCYLPKFLRDPTMPLYHDELGHWLQVQHILTHQTLFLSNDIISIIQFFPGLHDATTVLVETSGLSTFQVGVAILALLHAASVLGIWTLADALWGSDRISGYAAAIYALNPSFMYFDSQFAYESLAIVFLIWTLAAGARLYGRESGNQGPWFFLAALLGFATVITHHITSYVLLLTLLLAAALAWWKWLNEPGRGDSKRLLSSIVLAGVIASYAAAWFAVVASDVVGYLTPNISRGVGEVVKLIKGEYTARHLFALTTSPSYERAASFAAPVIVGVAALWGLIVARRRGVWNAVGVAVILLGLLYFVSVPFILTSAGNEGARRSWAFEYIGVALLAGLAANALVQRVAHSTLWRRVNTVLVIPAALSVVMVGNVAADLNPEYRFPGPYVFGSDTRSLTPELRGAAHWFRRTYGRGQRIVADRFAGLAFSTYANARTARPSKGFPVYHLYFQRRPPKPDLVGALRSGGYRFLVVDPRLAKRTPRIGFYLDPNEPGAFKEGELPPPPRAVKKYDRLPWTTRVFASSHLYVYRFGFDAFHQRPLYPGGNRASGR